MEQQGGDCNRNEAHRQIPRWPDRAASTLKREEHSIPQERPSRRHRRQSLHVARHGRAIVCRLLRLCKPATRGASHGRGKTPLRRQRRKTALRPSQLCLQLPREPACSMVMPRRRTKRRSGTCTQSTLPSAQAMIRCSSHAYPNASGQACHSSIIRAREHHISRTILSQCAATTSPRAQSTRTTTRDQQQTPRRTAPCERRVLRQ